MKKQNIVRWITGCLAATALPGRAQDSSSPAQFDPPAAVGKLSSADRDLSAPGSSMARFGGGPLFSWRGFALRPHLDFSVTYGDGVQSRPGVERKTWMESVAPGLLFEIGPRWHIDYTPRLNFYSHQDFRDTVAHRASLAGGFDWKDWRFRVGQSYSISEDPLVETGSQTKQESFGTSLGASHPLGSKMLLELGLTQSFRFTEGGLNDYKSWSTMNWLNYQIARRLSVAGGLGLGYDDVSKGRDMLHEQIQARVNYRIADKVNLAVNGGAEIRQFAEGDSGNLVNPVYGASIQYRPFDYTTLSLTGARHTSPSLFNDRITENTSISLALNQRLLEMFYLTLSGGYSLTDYVSSTDLEVDRSDDRISFLASLSYRIKRRASASLFYQYSDNSSNLARFDYDISTVGLNLSYRF